MKFRESSILQPPNHRVFVVTFPPFFIAPLRRIFFASLLPFSALLTGADGRAVGNDIAAQATERQALKQQQRLPRHFSRGGESGEKVGLRFKLHRQMGGSLFPWK